MYLLLRDDTRQTINSKQEMAYRCTAGLQEKDNEDRASDSSPEDQCPAVALRDSCCEIKLCPVSFVCADMAAPPHL
jgi:hypothetical protein